MTSVGKYTLLREFQDREAPTYAARCEGGDGAYELVAIERYATDITADAEDEATLEEAAHRAQVLTELYHPNLSTVRDVVVSGKDVLVVSSFVDGESYDSLMPGGKAFAECSFALKLAIVSDAVEGLASLHEFARGRGATLVHGGVTPRNVILCSDGRARLARVCNLFPEQVSPASPTLGYIAPELLDPSRQPEPSVDVFGAGVMLWEVLAGKRLAVQTNAPSLLLMEFEKGPPRGIPLESLAWAKAFIPIVERALARSDKRYADAEQMARAMRAVFEAAGPGVRARASVDEVAEFVERAAGDRIRERRAELGFTAPLPMHSSRATIAPKRSRTSIASIPEVHLPPPPRVARIKLSTMVDEDEYASPLRLAASDQDDNLAALAPIDPEGDTFLVDVRARELLYRGGEPTDERDALREAAAEDELRGAEVHHGALHDRALDHGAHGDAPAEGELSRFSSLSVFPAPQPTRTTEPLFEDRRGRRPLFWGGMALIVVLAVIFGYGLGRGQKNLARPAAAAPRLEVAQAEPPKPEPPKVAAVAEPSAPQPAAPSGADAPFAASETSTTQFEVLDAPRTEAAVLEVPREAPRASSRRTRPGHGGSRLSENAAASPAPATPAPGPEPGDSTSSASSSNPSNPEARQKFNPQGI
ncbi:serine/threonine protein kinase [Pendulispora albinea]|uniref:Protein kinase n=1 Tax=Pendulispora albinea TaxID=2741071 RepID=A0ABZ2LN33_9BACT